MSEHKPDTDYGWDGESSGPFPTIECKHEPYCACQVFVQEDEPEGT